MRYSWRIDAQQGVQRLLRLQDYLARQQQPWLLALANQYLGDLFTDYPALQVTAASSTQRASPETRVPTPQHWLLEANAIFEALGDRLEQARTLSVLGSSLRGENPEAAVLTYQAALELFKAVGPDPYAANVLLDLAMACLDQGRTAEGFEYLRQMQKVGEQMGNRITIAHALSWQSIEAVRYSDLGHARKTRDENLLIFQEYRNEYYAWGLWESGEIERVAGEVEAAQRRFESARQLFAQLGVTEGLVFYHRGLGDLAQARGDYETAWQEFQTSLEIAQEVHHDWAAIYALCGLGRAALGLGQLDTAHEYFLMGLRASQPIRAWELAPVALAGLAAWYAATGKHEEAVELSNVVIHYCVTWNETKNYARSVIETAAGVLPSDVVEAAKGRGKIAAYETVASRLLER